MGKEFFEGPVAEETVDTTKRDVPPKANMIKKMRAELAAAELKNNQGLAKTLKREIMTLETEMGLEEGLQKAA